MPARDDRRPRRPTFGWSDGRALLVFLALVAGLGLYAYRHSHSAPQWPSVTYRPSLSRPLIGIARVADGDSLVIRGMRIRLTGIDAPELNQPCTDAKGQSWQCGRAAQRELRAHLGRRALKCEGNGFDRFGRALAVCFLPDGANVNAWLVRQGWAVASGYAGTYRTEQDEAKAARRGIWAGTFVFPAEWRHRRS
jgi:endonuclease YncB( thermonuclease family)